MNFLFNKVAVFKKKISYDIVSKREKLQIQDN